jgi:hypothetical protein
MKTIDKQSISCYLILEPCFKIRVMSNRIYVNGSAICCDAPIFKEADFASLTGAVRGDAISVAIKPFVKPVATLFLLFACHLFWNILINKLSIFNL